MKSRGSDRLLEGTFGVKVMHRSLMAGHPAPSLLNLALTLQPFNTYHLHLLTPAHHRHNRQSLLTCPTKTPMPVAMVIKDDTKALQVEENNTRCSWEGAGRGDHRCLNAAEERPWGNRPTCCQHSFAPSWPRSPPLSDREHV